MNYKIVKNSKVKVMVSRIKLSAFAICMIYFVSGCGRKGEIKDLISENYTNLEAGGAICFISYKESSETKWNVRTYSISGIVKWEEPWYQIVQTFPASYGMPEIMVLSDCVSMNEGIEFTSTIHRGNTDEKNSIKLKLPKCDYLTIDGCKCRFPDACIVLPRGEIIGKKLDKVRFQTNMEIVFKDCNDFVDGIHKYLPDISAVVGKLMKVEYRRLNNLELEKYREECQRHISDIKPREEIFLKIKSGLQYFNNFPIKEMGENDSCSKLQQINGAGDEIQRILNMVTERIIQVKQEFDDRNRSGIVFLTIPTETSAAFLVKNGVMKPISETRVLNIKLGGGEIKVFDVDDTSGIKKQEKRNNQGQRERNRRR